MGILRFLKPGALVWATAWWVASFVGLRFGVIPPLPSSVVSMFMFIITLTLLAYLTSSTERMQEVTRALVVFVSDRRFRIRLIIGLVALPLLVAFRVYITVTERPEPPASARTIHPPPPDTIPFKGRQINLIAVENPFRELETSDADAFNTHVENGRRVYFQNCVFCHGADMRGDGLYTHGFDPIPTNFQDATTIAMLQESYLFWRIARGAPGLPSESAPWLSSMPAWETFLTEEEIWDVILFLYDYTDLRPRAREAHE